MEPLYKVGDKVVVIDRVAMSHDYRFSFVDAMAMCTGKVVTIVSVDTPPHTLGAGPRDVPDDGYRYKIVEDKGYYSWASSMFRPLVASDTPLTIKIKVKTKQLKFNFKN